MKRFIIFVLTFAVTACNKSKLPLTTAAADKIRGEWELTMFITINKDNSTFEEKRMPKPIFKFAGADTCIINGTSVQKFKILEEKMVYITKEPFTSMDYIYQDLYNLKLTGNDQMEWESNTWNLDRPKVAKIIYYFTRKKSVN